jgi:plastocyanin
MSSGHGLVKVRYTDEKFSYRFTNSGTHSYSCSFQPKMTGKIVVG